MIEQIYVAHWEGPFDWDDHANHVAPEHVLYALYGAHPLYGRDVLLYIGKAENGAGQRLPDHEWVDDEYDKVTVRLASVGKFIDWNDWEDNERYPRASATITSAVEALIILANQPVYNLRGKGTTTLATGCRLFNTGKLGHLLPESSYLYHEAE